MESLDQGLSVHRPQLEQLRDEKERVSWMEKEKMYVWVEAESTGEVVEVTVDVVGVWSDVNGWVGGEV